MCDDCFKYLMMTVSLLITKTFIIFYLSVQIGTNTTYTSHSINYKNTTLKDFSTFYTKLANSSHNSKNKIESTLGEGHITILHNDRYINMYYLKKNKVMTLMT